MQTTEADKLVSDKTKIVCIMLIPCILNRHFWKETIMETPNYRKVILTKLKDEKPKISWEKHMNTIDRYAKTSKLKFLNTHIVQADS